MFLASRMPPQCGSFHTGTRIEICANPFFYGNREPEAGSLGWIASMISGGSGPGRRHEDVRLFPSQLVRPRGSEKTPADIRVADGHVYITLHLPHIDGAELRYSVRGRYLLVWGEGGAHE